jgi:hypothetical protein
MPGLRLLKAHEVTVSSAHIPAQTDGDPAGEAPFTVTDSLEPIAVVVDASGPTGA